LGHELRQRHGRQREHRQGSAADVSDFGQLDKDYQSHSGAVNTGTTPKVGYTGSGPRFTPAAKVRRRERG
jgi:hypothetical protein